MNAAKVTDAFLTAMNNALRTSLATPMAGLFTGAPSLTRATVLADLVALAPTYTGYAEEALTLEAARRNANGDFIDPFASVTFQPNSPWAGPTEIATGYYVQVLVTAVETLWYAEYFDTPFSFVDFNSGLSFIIDNMVLNQTIWGGLCAFC